MANMANVANAPTDSTVPVLESTPFLSSLLRDNPYFSAGFGLLGVGTGLALLRQGVLRGAMMLRRRLLTTLEITSRDPAYPWILHWIARQPISSGGHFSLATGRRRGRECNHPASAASQFQLVPAPGTHYVRWQGRWLQIVRERERSLVDFGGAASAGATSTSFAAGPFETVTLTTLGTRRRGEPAIRSVLEEAQSIAARLEEGKLVVWTAWGQEWRPFGQPRRKRPLSSVVLAPGVSAALLADLREFLGAERWYQERGIPYRRGYLLEGPPGGGKSSLVQALAGELDYNICVVSLSEGWLTDDRFNHLLNTLPERSILLLEDIDAAGPNRATSSESQAASGSGGGRLSFSGLLNALDGVTSAEERIIFMTTNHCERLDPALVRPGRVDHHQRISWADDIQAAQLFLNFYPQHAHLAPAFSRAIDALGPVSPAAIQGHFIRYKTSPTAAVDNVHRLQDTAGVRPARSLQAVGDA